MTAYDALLIDLDGTLLDDTSRMPACNRDALRAAAARGTKIMIATGRSVISARPLVEELGLDTPAIVFNGGGLWCPRKKRLIEERVLSNRTLERALAFGAERELLTVLMMADQKLSSPPHDELEARALSGLKDLQIVPRAELRAEYVMRVTYFSSRHADSQLLELELQAAIDAPLYLTHFPLNAIPAQRESPLSVLDVHPPCRGKAEGVRVLAELYGIDATRVVALGDATNDIPMFQAAGLSVAMGDGMPEARAAAQRVIGGRNTSAVADLVEELFLSSAART